jgi:hypothetical protein
VPAGHYRGGLSKNSKPRNRYPAFIGLALSLLVGSCASYGPYHANTAAEPSKSVRGSADGRYKMAFVEFGDQGSPLDNSQRKAALEVIHKAKRPLLFVYIHGWLNDANSNDVYRFEHFLDTVSRFPEFTGQKIDVIGVYIAWRGKDLTVPGLNMFTFWSRKAAGGGIAGANSCLATIEELAVAAREPGKEYHHTVLMGHSFGALVLGNTISHSILGANGEGGRSSSPWDMAVAFNSADNSITTRQLMQEFDYLYKYDPQKRAYVSRGNLGEDATTVSENRPALVLLQSENDSATGQIFPMGQGLINVAALHFHWQKVPVPGHHGEKISENEFYSHTPGNNKYLVNYKVASLGEATPPAGLRAAENRAFEANIRQNHPDYSFYTSEQNTGSHPSYSKDGQYTPAPAQPAGNEVWRKWKFEYTGNARVPYWVVRVPKDIIWGHGGLWSDNSIAMFGALFRMEFPLNSAGKVTTPKARTAPKAPDLD